MKQHLITGFVIIIILTFSFLLIPRKAELGLMYKKGRQYDLAKYELKKQVANGDLSTSITIPLMELYLHFGEIYQAVDLMERYVDENPKDISAREMLGKLYRDGMVPHKYIANLEEITLLQPTEKRFRELIHLYQTHGRSEKASEYLNILMKQVPSNPKDHFTLAFLQAKKGNLPDALDTLEMFEKEHSQSVPLELKELQIHLLLNQNQIEQARKKATRWLAKNFSYDSLRRLVQLFRSQNQNASALQLMKTFDNLIKKTASKNRNSPEWSMDGMRNRAFGDEKGGVYSKGTSEEFLRSEYIDLQLQGLTRKETLAKMHALFKQEKLPNSLREDAIDLALELNDYSLLFEMALETAPEKVEQDLLLHLSEITLSAEVSNPMKKVLKKFGEGFLSQQPLLAARLMDRLNDREAALRWLQKAETRKDLTLEQEIDLINFYKKLGVPERGNSKREALAKMKELSKQEKLSDSLREETIDLALEVKDYSLLFDVILKTPPEKLKKEWLFNLTEIALSAEVGDSMKKVLQKFGDEYLASRPLLGARLMDRLDDKKSTIRWLEKVEAQPNLNLENYIGIIHFYSKLKIPERAKEKLDKDKIQSLIVKKLDEPGVPWSRKKELVQILTNLEMFKPALPHLETLAQSEGGEWGYYYENALERLKMTRKLAGYWEGKVKRKNLSLKEKRSMVFQLLKNNLKEDAEKLLKSMTENASPHSEDVLQLLFLWGPKVESEDLQWLISKAKASQGKDLAGWMNHLIQVDASKDALAVAKGKEISNKALFTIYLEALETVDDKDVVVAELGERIRTDKNTDRLFSYGKLAENLELYDTANLAFEKILDVEPGNGKAMKRLGFLNFYQQNWKIAEFYLEESMVKDKKDWKSYFYNAEAIFAQGKISKAEKYYLQALEMIQSSPEVLFDLQLARATCLLRLGRKKEALLAYEKLLKKNPNNPASRAKFIAALMEVREFDRAQALLESQ